MNNEAIKISVIMSVYNGAQFLKETIESVLKQSYCNFEFLITDNASTDDTVKIIRSYNDERINLTINEENKGYVANLNSMVKRAAGKYIIRQDADDIIRKDKFAKLVGFMEAHPSVGACGYYVNVFGSSKGKIKFELDNKKIRAAMLFQNQMDSLSIIRSTLFSISSLQFEESYIPTEDYKFWFEVMKTTELANIPYFLLDYRIHGTNTSIEKKEQGDRNRLQVQTEIFEYLFDCKITDEQKDAIKALYSSGDQLRDNECKKIISVLEKLAVISKNNSTIDTDTFIYYLARRWFIFSIKNCRKYLFSPNFIRPKHFVAFIKSLIEQKL